ncbi:hypothetical protein J5N97_003671 [Dioscorea zingiberensis]|uniref:Uncharacterized protein n=1 Tax=Dioscorea zingiberensis TaxID=325984 RepID=A0A9D5D749_9LILI|nr:hypothetical protein J5N97_003671 [Dioscorea zingiberensis]
MVKCRTTGGYAPEYAYPIFETYQPHLNTSTMSRTVMSRSTVACSVSIQKQLVQSTNPQMWKNIKQHMNTGNQKNRYPNHINKHSHDASKRYTIPGNKNAKETHTKG